MEQNDLISNWDKHFHDNFPLPPPENSDNDVSGWSLTFKELQNFTLSSELKSTPDTSTFGIKIYVSIFNTKTGIFHGRTWTSPLITNVNSNFINLTCYGILQGKDLLIVVEFAFCIQYFSNETIETSMFFTLIPQPTTSLEQICPLYHGSPRVLMAMPENFANGLTTREGVLLVELQKHEGLLKGVHYLPPCTFFNKPVPGIKSLMPFALEQVLPLTITGLVLSVQKDFQENLYAEIKKILGQKYRVPPQNVDMNILKYSIHIATHNTHKIVPDYYKAEVSAMNSWSFDGQIILSNFVRDPHFAIIFQLVVSIQIDLEFAKTNEVIQTPYPKEKQIFEIPLGSAKVVPTTTSSFTTTFSRDSRLSPFGIRILKTETPIPTISFDVSFTPVLGQTNESRDFPVDFKPLLMDNGGTLLPLDPKNTPEVPLIQSELEDQNNTNHLLFLFKFLTPRPCFTERFPLRTFRHLNISIDLWPFGMIQTKSFKFIALQDALIIHEDHTKQQDERGILIQKDVSLKVVEHVVNYFFLMRANELQASIIDTDTKIVLGSFNIPSAALIRQQRSSLQFSTYSKLTASDGELLGSIHFSCGCYGTADHKIATLEFEHRNMKEKNFIVARPIFQTDEKFRKSVKDSVLPRFELAARYRDGKRKEVLLNDMQKRFLRTRTIYPVPCLESRFLFVSAFDPEEKTTITVHSADERIRFIRKLSENDVSSANSFDRIFHIERDESLDFNQNPNVPIPEKFHLITQKNNSFVARPGEEIILQFAFFSATDFEDNEISVSLMNDKQTLLDCFTVLIKKTAPLAHENVRIAVHSGGSISTTLHSLHTITSAVSSSSLITATASDFGTRVYSTSLKTSLKCNILCFSQDNSILKLVRLHVDVLPDEVLSIDTKLKINISKFIGNRISCKTDDSRVAQFLTNTEPTTLKDTGEVVVKSLAAGVTQLVVYNVSSNLQAAAVLLKVGETKNELGNQKCLGKSDITLKVGESTKRTVLYKNVQNRPRTIRLTTSHPNLICFDPTHYDVGPQETVKLRIIFMANFKEEYVAIHAFVQESGQPRSANEFYKLHVHYVPAEKERRDTSDS